MKLDELTWRMTVMAMAACGVGCQGGDDPLATHVPEEIGADTGGATVDARDAAMDAEPPLAVPDPSGGPADATLSGPEPPSVDPDAGARPPADEPTPPGPPLEPIDAPLAPTPVPTVRCEVDEPTWETRAEPVAADCGGLLQPEPLPPAPLPDWVVSGWPQPPGSFCSPIALTFTDPLLLSGDRLHIGYRSHIPCSYPKPGAVSSVSFRAFYRTRGAGDWLQLLDDPNVVMALHGWDLYWIARPPSDPAARRESIEHIRTDATMARAAIPTLEQERVVALMATSRWLFSLSRPAEVPTTTLLRRPILEGGTAGPAEALLLFDKAPFSMTARQDVLMWAERDDGVVVVADASGAHRHVVAVPEHATVRQVLLTEGYGLIRLRHVVDAGSTSRNVHSICAVDLRDGTPRVLRPPAVLNAVAASAGHLYWSWSNGRWSQPEFTKQLWTQPVAGGPARALACSDDSAEFSRVAASESFVYWTGRVPDLRRLPAAPPPAAP